MDAAEDLSSSGVKVSVDWCMSRSVDISSVALEVKSGDDCITVYLSMEEAQELAAQILECASKLEVIENSQEG